jgi:methionyl-tRNA formyltransferase
MELLGLAGPVTSLRKPGRSWKAALREWLRSVGPDVLWVISFPGRLPADILGMPPAGCWNFHLGPLPEYRGADPVFWQIRNGEARGALSVHQMEASLDTGPLFRSYPVPIGPETTFGTHLRDLGRMAARAGKDLLHEWSPSGYRPLSPQAAEGVRTWPRPGLEDQVIEWASMSAREIDRLVRAGNPVYGGAKVACSGEVIQILAAAPLDRKSGAAPGTVTGLSAAGLDVACAGQSTLSLQVIGTREGLFHGPTWARLQALQPGDPMA